MDLFCEITVVNHSGLTLHVVSQTNTHGSWDFHGTHLIHPGDFGRFTGKDPAGAAVGSEGWVRFGDETGCAFSLAYCCSYKKDGNYAFVVEPSALLDVTLRFGHEVPPVAGDKSWGSATFPVGGHPLGILVYVEQRPAKRSLSVLTLNAHLLEGAKSVPADQICHDAERAEELMRRLAQIDEVDPDVVCLQGAWALAGRPLDATFAAYPFVYPTVDQGPQTLTGLWWDNWFSVLRVIPIVGPVISVSVLSAQLASLSHDLSVLCARWRDAIEETAGLLILSRYPLQDGRFTQFDGAAGTASLDRRGVLEATVHFPADDRTASTLRIGTTFGPSDTQAALRAMRDVAAAKALSDPSQDRILLGDFQLGETNTAERQALDTALGGRGATELVRRFLPSLDEAHTEWPAENSFCWALHKAASAAAPRQGMDRRDHMYFAPRERASFLGPAAVSIPRDWEIPTPLSAFDRTFEGLAVSDHHPVVARFDVAVPRVAPYPTFLDHRETVLSLAEIESGKYSFALAHGRRATLDADLYCIRRAGNPSGRIDLRVLDGTSRGASFRLEVPTRISLGEEASYAAFLMGDYRGRGVQDLYALKRGASHLEVHILDSRPAQGSPYWDFLLERGTPIGTADAADFEFFLGYYNSDGRPDLFCVKHRNTSHGKVEIHILSGTHDYQRFSLQTETTLPVDRGGRTRFGVARFRRAGGNSDVFAWKPGPRKLEVQVFDGTRRFEPWPTDFETALSAADVPNFDFLVADCAQTPLNGAIYGLKRRNTSHGKLEVHWIGRQGH